jgi:hypothetical protein
MTRTVRVRSNGKAQKISRKTKRDQLTAETNFVPFVDLCYDSDRTNEARSASLGKRAAR